MADKAGWADWPEGATPLQIYGVALLCGIGFTMSLFIGGLSFASVELQNEVTLGVFSGSFIAAMAVFLSCGWQSQGVFRTYLYATRHLGLSVFVRHPKRCQKNLTKRSA